MNVAPALSVTTVHPVYLRFVCTLLRQQGQDPDAVLDRAGLDRGAASGAGDWLALPAFERFLEVAADALDCPWFGLELGSRFQMVAYSAVGHALVTSDTLREALQLGCRYCSLRMRALTMRYGEGAGDAVLRLHVDCRSATARRILYEALLAQLFRLIESLTGATPDRLGLDMPFAAPPWVDRYRSFGVTAPRFGGEDMLLQIPHALLDSPCISADPKVCRRATRECEELLRLATSAPLSTRVRELVQNALEDPAEPATPEIAAVAERLHVSPRTLIRKLKREGNSFQGIVDTLRAERAAWLLQYTDKPVAEIAGQLGFEESSSFNRAFRRWFDTAPSTFRSDKK